MTFLESKQNAKDYVKGKLGLEESSLGRLWQHITKQGRNFAVISAYDIVLPKEVNEKRHEDLRKAIRSLGYGYIEQRSGYSYRSTSKENIMAEEMSFFIPSMTLEDAIQVGLQFDQESILYKDDSVFGLYMCDDGRLDMTFSTSEDKFFSISEEDIKIAYSQLIKGNHNHRVKISYIAEKKIPSKTDAYRALKDKSIPIEKWITVIE